MTNKHLDCINSLLKDNGEALTAYYDEAFNSGYNRGANSVACVLIFIGLSVMATNRVMDHYLSKKK